MKLPSPEKRTLSNWLQQTLAGIRSGRIEDTYGWVTRP